MRILILTFLVALSCASARGQALSDAVHSSDVGFSYSIPSDWLVQTSLASSAASQQKDANHASSAEEKKASNCVEVNLAARHGDPASVIVAIDLPFACYGRSFEADQLPGFGNGVAEGLQSSFDLDQPVTKTYPLGSHKLWIERAQGTPKAHAGQQYTLEIACTLLKKGAVCWMAVAADSTALAAFEHGAVRLEEDAPAALVPAGVFAATP